MEELTTFELLSINGGSEQSYENGKAAGQKVREIIDEFPDAYFWASMLCFVLFKVKI